MPDDDDTVDMNNISEVIRKVAEAAGALVVEHFVCVRCQHPQQTIHLWLERLRCSRCGMSQASSIPRRPQEGEVTVDHLAKAIATYDRAYAGLLAGREISVEPDVDCERKISPEDHAAVSFARTTLARVLALAEKFAAKETGNAGGTG